MNQSTFEKKILPWIVVLWFLVTIDSFFLWWSFGRIFRVVALLGMVFSTLIVSNRLRFSTYILLVFLSLLIYIIWLFPFVQNVYLLLVKIFDFSTFLLLLFWPKEVLKNCYRLLRKVIIFFAIGSSVVSVLSLVGVLQFLPHFTFEGRSNLHQSKGIVYYVYGVFVTLHSANEVGAARACGPVQEPGHWAIIIGLFYLIDRFALQKRNYWIILGGVLSFSSAFLLIFIATEIMALFSRHSIKQLRNLFLIVVGLLVVFSLLPQNIRDNVNYLFFERNLESVYESYSENESLTDALDMRASNYSIGLYYNLSSHDFWFGLGYRDTTSAISDHRGTILYIGLLGLILSIIPSVLIIFKAKWRLFIALGFSLFSVYIHRGWMFYTPYIYYLAFMAVSLSSMPIEESDKILVEKVEDNSSASLVLDNV